MIFCKEQSLYIGGECERCGSSLKAYWHHLSETADGYIIKPPIPCSCGRFHGQIVGKERLAKQKPLRKEPAKAASRTSRRSARSSRKRRAQRGPLDFHTPSAARPARESRSEEPPSAPAPQPTRRRYKALGLAAVAFLLVAIGWRTFAWPTDSRPAAAQSTAQQAEPQEPPSVLRDLDAQLAFYHSAETVWEQTFSQLANGDISHAVAYAKLKQLHSGLNQSSLEFSRYKPPKQLSKEQQDKLNSAARTLSIAAARRSEAAAAALGWIDAPTAASEQQFRGAIADSQSFAATALTQIEQVRAELPTP